MGLVLCNNYPTTIWTSIMFYSPETCGGEGGDFEKMGWWPIAPRSLRSGLCQRSRRSQSLLVLLRRG